MSAAAADGGGTGASDPTRLDGKTALVTGASRGIGAAVARRLAGAGAHVVLTFKDGQGKAQAVVDDIAAAGGRALAVQADSADPDAVERAVATCVRTFGTLDILVNNAGFGIAAQMGEITLSDFDAVFAVNLRAAFVAMNAAARVMPDGGRIISIGSINAERLPFTGGAVYGAAKAALIGLTKGAARDLGSRGITVNVIEPGPIDTDMNPADGPWAAGGRAMTALGAYGSADDVAGLALFLAGAGGAFVTGARLAIDGGYSA